MLLLPSSIRMATEATGVAIANLEPSVLTPAEKATDMMPVAFCFIAGKRLSGHQYLELANPEQPKVARKP